MAKRNGGEKHAEIWGATPTGQGSRRHGMAQVVRDNKYIDPEDGHEEAGSWDDSAVDEFRIVKRRLSGEQKYVHVAICVDLCVKNGIWTPDGP